jgi:DnaB-like helicase C terminal domain
MATLKNNSLLAEDFLQSLYKTCLENDYVLAMVTEHLSPTQLPDKDYQAIHRTLKKYYKEYKKLPGAGMLKQMMAGNRAAGALIDEIDIDGRGLSTDEALGQLENYIKQVRFQQAYKTAGEFYNKNNGDEAAKVMLEFSEWHKGFNLRGNGFVDVVKGFEMKFMANRSKRNEAGSRAPITRFYIDELDSRNGGRDLRGQLTCFLASTGVGKSHIARWVGKNACQVDGLNVLHFQLEGSEDEVVNAYSASLVECNTFRFETGTLRDSEVERMVSDLKQVSGTLHVKAYPKFNSHISTVDISNAIQEFEKLKGIKPDVIVIDSMDLLTDASGRHYTEKGERLKRIAVANDLKDLAADVNAWIVVTYQSTIENQDWLNDEKNVLTAYNTAEAKGLTRPLTHLITLNQSSREEKERTMRIHVAKSRFFPKGEAFRIATDYDKERFYDRERTMNINKVIC